MKYKVRVVTNAKIKKVEQTDDLVKVWMPQKPISGEANLALIEVLSDHFGVKSKYVTIVSGFRAKNKIVEIDLNGAKS